LYNGDIIYLLYMILLLDRIAIMMYKIHNKPNYGQYTLSV